MNIVCVPAYNEEKLISQVLMNILGQVSTDTHVIVISDNSTDETDKKVKELQKEHSNLFFIRNDKRCGKARAINTVMSKYPGGIILVHDADLFARHGAIQKLFQAFEDPTLGLVSGCARPIGDKTKMIQYWASLMYEYTNHKLSIENQTGKVISIIGGFYAFRIDAMNRITENVIADDKFTAHRVCSEYLGKYDPMAQVLIVTPKTLGDLYSQLRRWIYGNYQFKNMSQIHAPTLNKIRGFYYLVNVMRKTRFNPKIVLWVLALGIFYVVTDFSALVAFKLKMDNPLWNPVQSTKLFYKYSELL